MKKVLVLSCMIMTLVLQHPGCHPHLFIEPAVTVVQTEEGDGIAGIRMIWTWDHSWSYMIIRKCDRNEDGIFTGRELELVYKDFFIELEDLDFFCKVSINGEEQSLGSAEEFTALSNREQIVTFLFFVPLAYPLRDTAEIKIIFSDGSLTAAFIRDVRVRTTGPAAISTVQTERVKSFGVQASFTLSAESSDNGTLAR
jgi:ABC-type uncharacterized transport system substrate-binding protein